ncbi:MAG: hypothetical protein JXC36_06775 [Candidatus Atribacteria bacterium]|nr:hypothetical protein [Candidatus Atribacteria bacterium]
MAKNKTVVLFSISTMFYSFASLLSSLVVIRWISPELMGFWGTVILFQAYSFFLQLGTLSGLGRELPFYLGKNEKEKALSLAGTASYFSLICMGAVFLLTMITLTYFIIIGSDRNLIITIFVVGVSSAINFYQNYLIVTFRSNKSFNKLSKVYFVQSIVIIASIILVYKYQYTGFVFRYLLLTIFLTILLFYVRPIKEAISFEITNFKLLIKTGFKMYSLGYLNNVIQSLNRVILVSLSGPLLVGLYMPSLAILNVMKMLPSSLGQYLYPKMTYELGKTGDKKKIWKWVWKSAFILIIALIPFGIIGWYVLPPFVEFMFPKYIEGIRAAQLSIISGIISGSLIGINVINSLKAYKTLALLTAIKFVLYVSLMYLFTQLLDPLTGIALGLVIADLLYFIVALYACYYNLIIYEKHE